MYYISRFKVISKNLKIIIIIAFIHILHGIKKKTTNLIQWTGLESASLCMR